MKRKKIKFPIKKKELRDKDMDIEEFIDQVDANIKEMDREFKEFQIRYGEDKSFHDWIAYEEEEKRKKEKKINLRVDSLSFCFKKKINSKKSDK